MCGVAVGADGLTIELELYLHFHSHLVLYITHSLTTLGLKSRNAHVLASMRNAES
jgi:hypothetical protein